MDGDPSEGDLRETMTLAFHLAAIRTLLSPTRVFADARTWSTHVGVIGDDPEAVYGFVADHRLQQDYDVSELDPMAVLSKLRWEADTDRYVLIGTTGEHEALADHVGWEYLPVETAAKKAGWTRRADASLLQRIKARVYRL